MFVRFSLVLLMITAVAVCVHAQTPTPSSGTATLLSRTVDKDTKADNYTLAAYSFEKNTNGDSSLGVTHNDWDILFSTIRYDDGRVVEDIFDVSLTGNDRSRLLDLGKVGFDDIFVPYLPAFEKPAREKYAVAVAGHTYLVHTADGNSDLQTLFRVDELKSGESVTITWKVISPTGVQN